MDEELLRRIERRAVELGLAYVVKPLNGQGFVKLADAHEVGDLVDLFKIAAEECALIAETAPDCLQDSTFGGVARAIRKAFSIES